MKQKPIAGLMEMTKFMIWLNEMTGIDTESKEAFAMLYRFEQGYTIAVFDHLGKGIGQVKELKPKKTDPIDHFL